MKKLTLNGPIVMNCYIIEYQNNCFIVDPGYKDESIVNYVKDSGLEVMGILLTHGHPDHFGGIDCFEVPIYVHKKDEEMIMQRISGNYNSPRFEAPSMLNLSNFIQVEDNSVIPLGDKEIRVMYTPGHSVGGVCYIFEEDIFSGDTLFSGGVGRWDFSTGDVVALQKSVIKLIDSQPENYLVHPGHGESTTIQREKMYNPYYLQWKENK